ncbi:sigma factor-like helix-turn-helix DNA-binding protein, partial [Arthrospira platensis SPKY1]|nr:sigma factor-like helix-turn-helix DNA-binding protein [Arthrospira platensis SPKY1]
QQLLQRTVDQLPDKFRMLIIMKYYDEMSYKEIALIMKIEEKKVRSRLFEARELLRKKLLQHAYFSK